MNTKTKKTIVTALAATMGAGMASQLVQAAVQTPEVIAEQAVVLMEKEKTGKSIDAALEAVNALEAGKDKDALMDRITVVGTAHHKSVYDIVAAARTSKDLKDIADARVAVAGMAKVFINDGYTWSADLDTLTIAHQVVVVDTLNAIKPAEVKQATIDNLYTLIEGLHLQDATNEGLKKLVLDYSATLDTVQFDYAVSVKTAVETAKTAEELVAAKAKYADLMTMKNKTVLATYTAIIDPIVAAKDAELLVAKIASVTAIDTNKVEVKFNKAVDVTKATVELKQGSATRYTVAKWSEDKTTVVLEAPSAISVGDYKVVVTGLSTEALTGDVKFEATRIENVVVDTKEVIDGTKATVNFEVRNQYGTNMDVKGDNSGLTISAYNVTQGKQITVSDKSATKSEFALDLLTTVEDAKVNDEIRVVVSYKGATVTQTVKVVKAANYGTISLGSAVLPEKAVRFQPGQNSVKVPVSMKDTNGKDIKLTEAMLGTDITIVSSDTTKAEISTTAAKKVDDDGNLLVDLKAEGNVVFTAIINGESTAVSTTSIKIEKLPEVAAVSISSPTKLVAAGESVTLNVAAVDQYGDKIDYAGDFLLNAASTPVKVVDGKVTLTNVAEGDLTLVARVGTKEVGKVAFKVEKAAEPTAIVGVDVATLYENGAKDVVELKDIKVKDQYGRDYALKTSDVINVIAKDGTADSVTSAVDAGTKAITFTGTANTNNEVITLTLANGAKFDITLASVKAEDIKSYELASVPTLLAGGSASYYGEVKLTGKTSAGKVVALVNDKITGYTTSNAKVATASASGIVGLTKGTATIAVWNGTTKLAETTVTVSDEASVVKSVEFKSDFTTITGTADLATKLVVKDQYGVVIAANGMFTTSDSSIATILGNTLTVVAPGKVTVGYVSTNGLVVTKEISVTK